MMKKPQHQMLVRVNPYEHQVKAFDFACELFGVADGGDAQHSVSCNSCALLMEM